MPDIVTSDPTLITGTETTGPEQVTRTRTIDDLVEEAGLLRSQTRLLGDDVAETNRRAGEVHRQAVARQLDAKARGLARGGMGELLNQLADCGFAWRDIAALARVSVPAVRRWRQGETPTGEHLLEVARLVRPCSTNGSRAGARSTAPTTRCSRRRTASSAPDPHLRKAREPGDLGYA